MQLFQLKIFIDAVTYKNFTKVAEVNHFTQPAVSKQIKALENELGFALFKRNNRKVELTPAGQSYYDSLLPLLNSLSEAASNAKKISEGQIETIKIAYISSYSMQQFVDIVREFNQKYPHIQLSYFNKASSLSEHVNLDSYDLVFGEDNILAGFKKMTFVPFYPVQYHFILHKGDKLAEKTSLSLKDLDGRDFIIPYYYRFLENNKMYELFEMECPHSKMCFAESIDDIFLSIKADSNFALLPDYCFHEDDNFVRIPAQLPIEVIFGISVNNNSKNEYTECYIKFARGKRSTP